MDGKTRLGKWYWTTSLILTQCVFHNRNNAGYDKSSLTVSALYTDLPTSSLYYYPDI